MQQLPIGPAIRYVRTAAGKSQSQLGGREAVSYFELSKGEPRVSTLVKMLYKAGARLVIVTKAGEQVEVVNNEAKP